MLASQISKRAIHFLLLWWIHLGLEYIKQPLLMLHHCMCNKIPLREEEYMQLMREKLWNRTKKNLRFLNTVESTCFHLNAKKEMCTHTCTHTDTHIGKRFCKDIFHIVWCSFPLIKIYKMTSYLCIWEQILLAEGESALLRWTSHVNRDFRMLFNTTFVNNSFKRLLLWLLSA